MEFPNHIYTLDEFKTARAALAKGYKHELRVTGHSAFKRKVEKMLELIRIAGYMDFLLTYIREIKEVDGLGQLRETEATVWLSHPLLSDRLEGARFVIQKCFQMKAYLEGRPWYILGELPAIKGSIQFLSQLFERTTDPNLKELCKRLIERWTEDKVT